MIVLTSIIFVLASISVQGREFRRLKEGNNGLPNVIEGNLGKIGVVVKPKNANKIKQKAAVHAKAIVSDLGITANFVPKKGKKTYISPSGRAHVRIQSVVQGMPVEASGLVVHIEKDGTISSVTGEIAVDTTLGEPQPLLPEVALAAALEELGLSGAGEWEGEPVLAAVLTDQGTTCIAWKQAYRYDLVGSDGWDVPYLDEIYADISTGEVCQVIPLILNALSTDTRHCFNNVDTNAGEAVCSTVSTSTSDISTGDEAIDKAHNYVIATYEYYAQNFGRDSIDDNGMKLISRVHYGSNYNNAFWNGRYMTYGDGDGSYFTALSKDADVVAHELTHGVTGADSGLLYRDESGALNEAFSDIFGSMVDAFVGATGMDVWKVGEDIYNPADNPALAGDALRYMYNPMLDKQSPDYYPERYRGTGDRGGVHWNSGIANLAFYLLSEGGVHPRVGAGIPSVSVAGIGKDSAARIFYRANFVYLTSQSNFLAAREATITAAADEFPGDASIASSVAAAWDAVGVTEDGTGLIEIYSGVPVGPITMFEGSIREHYILDLAPGETASCQIVGNHGDADLYMNWGERTGPGLPFICRPYLVGSNEICEGFVATEVTTLHVAVHAYNDVSGLSLICTITPAPSTELVDGTSVTGIALPKGKVRKYFMPAVGVGDSVECSTSGFSGNADLYLRWGSEPTTSTFDCRGQTLSSMETCSVVSPGNAVLYVDVLASEAFSDLSLVCRVAPAANAPMQINEGVSQTGIALASGTTQQFYLDVPAGNSVDCATSGGVDGNADLFLRYDAEAQVPDAGQNECSSTSAGSSEACSASETTSNSVLYAAVHASSSFSDLSLVCMLVPAPTQACTLGQSGDSCVSHSDCCPEFECRGRTGRMRCKSPRF